MVEVALDGRTLQGCATRVTPPDAWLDRAHRFIRPARKTGLSFTGLDRVVGAFTSVLERSRCWRAVVAAVHLNRTHDVPFDLVETLTTRTPPAVVDAELPRPAGDILAPQNRPFRRELARSMEMAELELVETVTRFRALYAGPLEESPFDREISRASIVVLHLVARLTGHLGLSVAELFAVLTALENDPAIERHSTFPVLPVLAPDVGRRLPDARPRRRPGLLALAGPDPGRGCPADADLGIRGGGPDGDPRRTGHAGVRGGAGRGRRHDRRAVRGCRLHPGDPRLRPVR